MTLSVLLERNAPQLPALYRCLADPQPAWLFDATALHDCTAHSPMWLQIGADASALEHAHDAPQPCPGLLIESQASREVLLAHLRHILFVRFEQTRQGVLRYWSPTTASYFFTAEAADALPTWMGPISRLSWYGGTWADVAQGTCRPFIVENLDAANWKPPVAPPTLSLHPVHAQALARQQREHFVHDWYLRQSGISFAAAIEHLAQGMREGLSGVKELEQYLNQLSAAAVSPTPGIAMPDSEPRT